MPDDKPIYNGVDRREKDLMTEHRLSVIETHVPQIYEQIKDIRNDIKEDGAVTREAFKEHAGAIRGRVSSLEHWRTGLAAAYTTTCLVVGGIVTWFKTHGK